MADLKTDQWIVNELCNWAKAYISKADWALWPFVFLECQQQVQLRYQPCILTLSVSSVYNMSTRVKVEPEEEVQPSTSGGDVQPEQQPEQRPEMEKKVVREASDSEETLDSDDIDDEFITQYCETVDSVRPMTVSRELFYTDSMVARNYERLSEEDKKRFDQMKELAESAKQETGEYSLIEDLMARVVGDRFGTMKAQDVEAVMGKPGEGAEGGETC